MALTGTRQLDPVDWKIAENLAIRALRFGAPASAPVTAAMQAQFDELTGRAQDLVSQVTGLHSAAGRAHARVVDREGWVHANISSFRRLLRPLGERLATEGRAGRRALDPTNRAAAGVEVGLLLAWMSGRVLGQYDAVGEGADDAVYYVGTNVAQLEARHGFDPEQFRMWIALHETTHRLQFTGVDWMRGYFLELVGRGTALVSPDARFVVERLRTAASELWAGRNPLAEGGFVALFATSDQLQTLREAQGLMSLLEGHATAVMSEAAPALVPDSGHFAAVLAERRGSASGLGRIVQQALGIEAKLRQYSEGEGFVQGVLEAGGAPLFAEVWRSPADLPSVEEIRDPLLWVERHRAGALA